MLLGFVAVMGANLMESLYISQVGTLELAALGFTFPLVMMMQGVTRGSVLALRQSLRARSAPMIGLKQNG